MPLTGQRGLGGGVGSGGGGQNSARASSQFQPSSLVLCPLVTLSLWRQGCDMSNRSLGDSKSSSAPSVTFPALAQASPARAGIHYGRTFPGTILEPRKIGEMGQGWQRKEGERPGLRSALDKGA